MSLRSIERLLDRLRPGWRERREKRKSPWNLAGMLVAFALLPLLWYGLFLAMWRLHVRLQPEDRTEIARFWRPGLPLRVFVPSFLLAMPLAVPAAVASMLASNGVLWCIPRARRALESEAAGDREMTFRGSCAGLLREGGIAAAIGLALSLLGAVLLRQSR